MTIKTTGREFKQFYNDNSWWSPETWHEDDEISINGAERDDEMELGAIPDDVIVSISGGVVLGLPDGKQPTLEAYFKRWRKEQNTAHLVVECSKEAVQTVMSAVKAAGGKVVK